MGLKVPKTSSALTSSLTAFWTISDVFIAAQTPEILNANSIFWSSTVHLFQRLVKRGIWLCRCGVWAKPQPFWFIPHSKTTKNYQKHPFLSLASIVRLSGTEIKKTCRKKTSERGPRICDPPLVCKPKIMSFNVKSLWQVLVKVATKSVFSWV